MCMAGTDRHMRTARDDRRLPLPRRHRARIHRQQAQAVAKPFALQYRHVRRRDAGQFKDPLAQSRGNRRMRWRHGLPQRAGHRRLAAGLRQLLRRELQPADPGHRPNQHRHQRQHQQALDDRLPLLPSGTTEIPIPLHHGALRAGEASARVTAERRACQ
ncbi:hypothetical protein D3C87_1612260 [compost metagenome]